jgi:hypothetical protein
MSGPCGLGLRIDPLSKGGVVVVVVQGTCIASVFDLVQHVWSRYLDKLRDSPNADDNLQGIDLQAGFPGWTRFATEEGRSGSSECVSPKVMGDVDALEATLVVKAGQAVREAVFPDSPAAGVSLSRDGASKTAYSTSSNTAGDARVAHAMHSTVMSPIRFDERENTRTSVSNANPSKTKTASSMNTAALHTIINTQPLLKLTLVACFETEDDIIERKVLTWLHCNCPDIVIQFNVKRTKPIVSSSDDPDGTPALSTGRLNAERLLDVLPESDLLSVCCCGAPTFVQTVRVAYMSHGLPRAMFTVIA